MNVEKILQFKGHDYHAILPEASLLEACRIMHDRKIGFLIIKNGVQPLTGILSERDLIAAMAENGHTGLEMTVSQIMVTDIISCSPSDHPQDVLQLMNENKIRHLPVVDNDSLKGIISIRDVMRYIAEFASEQEKMGLWMHYVGI